jgi:hypothetical protein
MFHISETYSIEMYYLKEIKKFVKTWRMLNVKFSSKFLYFC